MRDIAALSCKGSQCSMTDRAGHMTWEGTIDRSEHLDHLVRSASCVQSGRSTARASLEPGPGTMHSVGDIGAAAL